MLLWKSIRFATIVILSWVTPLFVIQEVYGSRKIFIRKFRNQPKDEVNLFIARCQIVRAQGFYDSHIPKAEILGIVSEEIQSFMHDKHEHLLHELRCYMIWIQMYKRQLNPRQRRETSCSFNLFWTTTSLKSVKILQKRSPGAYLNSIQRSSTTNCRFLELLS